MNIKTLLVLSLLLSSTFLIAKPNQELPKKGTGPWIVNVHYKDLKQLQNYAKLNAPWSVNKKNKSFIISVDNLHTYQELFSYGFDVEINQKRMTKYNHDQELIARSLARSNNTNLKSIPGYSCIRTVEETFTTMSTLNSTYPGFVELVDIGDTWEKQTAGGLPGFDMQVIKITNENIAGPKPILYATSSIHAREMAPAELNTRFAEYLLNNYATDADAKWIVDHREVHLLLQGNPDGRKRAEVADTSKRKNQNNNFCSGNNTRGVDMNRNFPWMWNQGSGSSSDQCSQVFRGPSASSESENTAIDDYLNLLFIDNRGPALSDAAPSDTSGVYLDIHSVASLILWPYGFDDPEAIPLAPNHNQLQTLGRKFGWFNNYYPEPSNELYGADGAADDNAYGQLGVAAYTFELGGGSFRPTCSTFNTTILPNNLTALIYAAKVADTPYITASGPDIENLTFDSSNVAAGTIISVSGLASDLHFNNANGTESTQNITSVDMYIDELPWDIASTATNMVATDGSYNAKTESFSGSINTTGMASGQHIVYLQTTDASGVTGVPYAKFFTIINAVDLGTVSGTITDAVTSLPINAVNVTLDSQSTSTNASGFYQFSILAGNYNLTANKQDYATANSTNISVTAQQTTNLDLQLQPICAFIDDNVNSYATINAALTAGWSHAAAEGTDDWEVVTTDGIGSSGAFRTENVNEVSDKSLISPTLNLTADSTLEFWHKHEFEDDYDGAILEITTNNGSSWSDLGSSITIGGYNTTLNGGSDQPLGAVQAWGNNLNTFTKVEVNLSAYAGQTAKIRWRFGSDNTIGDGHWFIDNIKVLDPTACEPPLQIIFKHGFE